MIKLRVLLCKMIVLEMLLIFSLIFFECKKVVNINPATTSLSPQEAFLSARSYYKGDVKSALAGLKELEKSFQSGYLSVAFHFGLDICLDQTSQKDVVEECKRYFETAKSSLGQLYITPVLSGQAIFLLSTDATLSDSVASNGCSEVEKKIAGFTDVFIQSKKEPPTFFKGLQIFCNQDKVKAETFFSTASEEFGNTRENVPDLSPLARSYLIRLWRSKQEGDLFYSGYAYLSKFQYLKLNELLDTNKKKFPEKNPVWNLLYSEMINPFSGVSPYAKGKPHLKMLELLKEAEISSGKDCSSTGCRILFSEIERIKGEIAYTRGDYKTSEKYFDSCIEKWKFQNGCYENLMITGMSSGNSKVTDKYKGEISSRLNRSFLFKEFQDKNSSNKDSFLPSYNNQSVKIHPNSNFAKKLKNILSRMAGNPYLKGKIPGEVEIYDADYENAEAHYLGSVNKIYIGNKLLEEILIAIKEGNFRDDSKEDDVIAAIIGHELHHIAGGHGLDTCTAKNHPKEYKFADSGNKDTTSEATRSELWRKEFEADEMGLFYAFVSGYRAQAFLSVLEFWNRKNPVQPVTENSHPPFRNRLAVLSKKVKILQTTANIYSSALGKLKDVEKEISENGINTDRKKLSNKLSEAEILLEKAESNLPGHPSIAINRSYILLRGLNLSVSNPELPAFPFLDNQPGFIPPIGGKETFGIQGDEILSKYILTKYRSSLLKNPYLKNKEIPNLKKAIQILETANSRYPENYKILNNLGLSWYYLADIEIRNYFATGKWTDKKKTLGYLKQALNYLNKSLPLSKEDSHKVTISIATVLTAICHLDDSLSLTKLEAAFSVLLGEKKAKEFVKFLEHPPVENEKQSSAFNLEFLSIDLEKNGGDFIIPYLTLVHYADKEKEAGTETELLLGIKPNKEKLIQIIGLFADEDKPSFIRKNNYWTKELSEIKKMLEKKSEL